MLLGRVRPCVCVCGQVHGYPTIKMFAAGKKDAGDAVEYDGGRTSDAIVAWALEKVAENVPPPDVFEVIRDDRVSISQVYFARSSFV